MRRLLLLGAALLPMAGVAHAQSSGPVRASDEPLDVDVADRPRPDYAPIGGRIGSFFLYPRLDLSAQYNSNLLATQTNTISDEVFDVRPSIDFQSQWTRNRLDFNAYFDQTLHGKYTTENFSQYGGSVTGDYDAGHSTFIDATASASRLTEPRTDINAAFVSDSRTPIRFSNLGLNVSLRREFSRLGVTVNGSVVKQRFDDGVAFDGTPLPQGFRDNTYLDGSIEGRYLIGAGTRLVARAEVGSIDYDENPYAGFDRNSRSYRIEGGLAVDITRLIHGEVRVGYFKEDNFDPRFLDDTGISFSANVLYNPTARTSIRLIADRSVEPSASTVSSGDVRSTLSLNVDQELLPNLVGTLYGRYANINPQGPISDADEYEGRAGLQYYLSRRFRFTLGVDQFSRRSVSFGSFDVTTATVGVGISL